MATQPDTEQPVTPDTEPQQPPEGPNAPEDDGSEAHEPDPVEARVTELAESLGWRPLDQYKGDPALWKPAEQFIRDGKDVQRAYYNEIKDVKRQLDVISRTSATTAQQALETQRNNLLNEYQRAFDDGDMKAAWQAKERFDGLGQQAQMIQAPQGPSSEAQQWVQHNPWMDTDPLAAARAAEVCNIYASRGYPHAAQLAEAEKVIRRERPDLFGGSQPMNGQYKAQASVNTPGSRSGSPSNRAKGFSDLPPAAQKVANDMVDRGVIPNKDLYVKNYFAELERKV